MFIVSCQIYPFEFFWSEQIYYFYHAMTCNPKSNLFHGTFIFYLTQPMDGDTGCGPIEICGLVLNLNLIFFTLTY